MFQPKDFIIYRNHGVYQISHVESMSIPSNTPARDCFVLQPVVGTETIYAPVAHAKNFRRVMSKEEAREFIDQIPLSLKILPDQTNFAAQKAAYEECLTSGDYDKLVQLLHTINRKMDDTLNKKQPSQIEMQYYKRAEAILHAELSISLGIPMEQVGDYIHQQLNVAD